MKVLIAAMPAMLLAGCGETAPSKEKSVEATNPASEHCVKLGGTVEIRKEANGEVGYCHLPDGRVIDEWQLFRSSASEQAKP